MYGKAMKVVIGILTAFVFLTVAAIIVIGLAPIADPITTPTPTIAATPTPTLVPTPTLSQEEIDIWGPSIGLDDEDMYLYFPIEVDPVVYGIGDTYEGELVKITFTDCYAEHIGMDCFYFAEMKVENNLGATTTFYVGELTNSDNFYHERSQDSFPDDTSIVKVDEIKEGRICYTSGGKVVDYLTLYYMSPMDGSIHYFKLFVRWL